MGRLARSKDPAVVVKTYGRGSLLGLLSIPFAFLMAYRSMNGWREKAVRDMEDDAVEMSRQGYRVAATGEYGIPALGITYYKVTYQLADRG